MVTDTSENGLMTKCMVKEFTIMLRGVLDIKGNISNTKNKVKAYKLTRLAQNTKASSLTISCMDMVL